MAGRTVQGLTIKAAFVIGFSLTLGVWLFTGYDISRRMSALQRDVTEVNARYMRAQDLLSTVRAQILLGSIDMRDALLDTSPGSIDASLQRLQDTSTAIDQSLERYQPIFGSEDERQRVAHLRRELVEFGSAMKSLRGLGTSVAPGEARRVLREQVVPHRETIIRVSEDVQALNRQAFVEQQAGLAAVYDTAERRTWQRLGLALAGSLGIALLATLYGTRLELRLQQQRERDQQNASDLQRLSAQLITAQEDERRAIARELHDEVGQVLTAIKMELSVAQRTMEHAGVTGKPLQSAQTIADSALQSVRDLSRLLHPSLLDDLGLPAAVRAHTQRFGERHGIRVDLQVEEMDERVDRRLEAAVYRIIQESLTNIARHARVQSCRVRLARDDGRLQVRVEDAGRGFEAGRPDAPASRGLGLIGMRERATQFGGRFRLYSAPGQGTRVYVDFPISGVPVAAEPPTATDVLPG